MKLKNIVLSLLGTAVVLGGVIISFNQSQPMTFDEYQTLIKIYNYEIEKAGGKMILGDKNNPLGNKNILKELNKKLLNTSQPENIKIDGEILTKEDYQLLKSGLFRKSEQ